MYRKGDIVLVRLRLVPGAPNIHVKLLKKEIAKKHKGKYDDFPGYVGWHCILVDKDECEILRTRWCIPFSFPDDVETFVFEEEIIRRIDKKIKAKTTYK